MRGGIFGRPSGQILDLVIGAARDRQGKVATVRGLVIPANPNTAAQQLQRGKFSDSLWVLRNWGPVVYQDDWNRAIGQLPGFQSLMSILMNNIDDLYQFTEPPDTPLGTLHFPSTWTPVQGVGADDVDITWSDELGSDGTAADKLQLIAVREGRDGSDEHPVVHVVDAAVRSDAAYTLDCGEATTHYIMSAWFQGVGTAEGSLTRAEWTAALTGAAP
jgi:hypothetical protein